MLVPFVWVAPSWHDILFGILIGVASTAGQWIVVLAFRYADASVLAPFSYTPAVWVSILGFLVFGEVPDIWTVVGAAFIVASGLYTAHRERVRRSQLLLIAERPRPTPDAPSDVAGRWCRKGATTRNRAVISYRRRDFSCE